MASQGVPPGYDSPTDTKAKTKSAKRNERKKEKRLLAALEKCKNSEAVADDEIKEDGLTEEDLDHGPESVKSLTSQMTDLAVSKNPIPTSSPSNLADVSDAGLPPQDLDKKIRVLKKKVRLAEAQQKRRTPQQDMKPEQLEKLAKLEGWLEELKFLEYKKAELAAL